MRTCRTRDRLARFAKVYCTMKLNESGHGDP